MAKLHLFSPVEGVVLSDGAPVAGAEVERIWNWAFRDQTGRDVVRTGPDGRFAFPEVVRSSLLAGVLPHQPVIDQKILIRHGGREYPAWMFSKHNYREAGETEVRPIRLVCRLDSEPTFRGKVYGIADIEG